MPGDGGQRVDGPGLPRRTRHARLAHVREVVAGYDAPDHDRDVRAPRAQGLDDQGREREVGAREHRESHRVDVLLDRGEGDGLGRLEQAGVDHFHARVAQETRDDLDAPVVAVEPDLGDENPDAHSDGVST